jgi:hypothetical protein
MKLFCKKENKETEHRLALRWQNSHYVTYYCRTENCTGVSCITVTEEKRLLMLQGVKE